MLECFMRRIALSIICLIVTSVSLTSCHESLEDRAERESKEYTQKFCPTPPQNEVITDSLVFNKATKTQTYYMRLTGSIDNPDALKGHEKELEKAMLNTVRQNPSIQPYKEAGFVFEYICRSDKNPKLMILHFKFGPKQYGTN